MLWIQAVGVDSQPGVILIQRNREMQLESQREGSVLAGFSDLVIDKIEQVSNLSEHPWEKIDPENHWVEVDLTSITNRGSRRE